MADCYREITKDGSYSSKTFRLESHEMKEYEALNKKWAKEAVDLVLRRETSCGLANVTKAGMLTTCYAFPHSDVTCEVPTSIGYFIVHRSSYGSFDHSIIYTRWD